MTAAGDRLVRALAASLPPPVDMRETHGAWVLLSGERAYKLRKPVRFAFLDYSSVDRRLAAAEAEVAVNAPLAGDLYRGVRPVLTAGAGVRLGPAGRDAGAVDYVVEMRRFDEARTMAAMLAGGRLTAEHVDAVARRLAAFHAAAEPCGRTGAEALRERVERDLDDIEALGGAVATLRAFARAALRRRAGELDGRARRGLRRDGHGDLRAEHVVFQDDLLVIDRLEFDAALRCADVAGDLAFLAMDLEALGAPWAAERLAGAYARAGGDPASPRLRALLAWQRALVRVKVALLRDDAGAAGHLLGVAGRLAWRERIPAVLVVGGPPASGKSTLATAVGAAARAPVISSDVVRKEQLGVTPTTRLGEAGYAEEVTLRVYRELGTRAARLLAGHGAVVVDATARSRALRAALLQPLRDAAPAVFVTCRADPGVLAERARARAGDPRRISDADPEVAVELARRFESVGAEPGVDRALELDTDRPVGELVDELAGRLDGA